MDSSADIEKKISMALNGILNVEGGTMKLIASEKAVTITQRVNAMV